MDSERKRRIDAINEWVRAYKEDGDRQARENLLKQFHPFFVQQARKWSEIYSGVHPWKHVEHEAMIIFCDLLDEYTIGGPAYFNVLIQRKLPFRLRYFFVKEIRRRTKHLSHSDEQFALMDGDSIPAVDDHSDGVVNAITNSVNLQAVRAAVHVLSDREKAIVALCFHQGLSHDAIAKRYGISRSRVSRIIKNAIEKIRKEMNIDV